MLFDSFDELDDFDMSDQGFQDELSSGMEDTSNDISFGASLPDLQNAATLSDMSKAYSGTEYEQILSSLADGLSGANMPGMEIIQDSVADASAFFGINPVNVYYTLQRHNMILFKRLKIQRHKRLDFGLVNGFNLC